MRHIRNILAIVSIAMSYAYSQTDNEPRLCDGMPTSQMAFAQALASGKLQSSAYNTLNTQLATKSQAAELYNGLFKPLPTSLLDLNGRIDLIVGARDIAVANQLRTDMNNVVAGLFTTVTHDSIACSISLLSFREASDVFGKRIATQYGVVQVTIRNTDPDHEFLLHQIDFWFGDTLQYFGTRDRKIARGVAEKGQVIDPRNYVIRILEGIGSVAGASTVPFEGNPQIGSAIFNSSFIPAVKAIFPDLTVPQIAKLDDLGFSAGASTMVIAKNGAIVVVAFIPADSMMVPKLAQYEQALNSAGQDPKKNYAKQMEDCNQTRLDLSQKKKTTDDIEVQKTIAACNNLLSQQTTPLFPALSAESMKVAKDKTRKRSLTKMFVKIGKTIDDFDPAATLLLQRDLHILLSGSHIQELPTQANVTAITCLPNPSGALLDGSTEECTINGTHLELLKQAQLVGKTQSAEAVSASAISPTKTDGTEVKAIFPGCSFAGKISTEYLMQFTDSRNVQQLNSITLSVKPAPSLACLAAGGGNYQCALQNLDEPAGTPVSLASASGGAAVSFNLGSAPVSVAIASGTYKVSVTPTGGSEMKLCMPVKVP